jgi:hypothetical protein
VLAVRVVPKVTGQVSAFRFYKAAGEGKSHTLRVYKAHTGDLLKTLYFTDPCAGPGWITISLPHPLTVLGGFEYVFTLEGVVFYPKSEHFFPANGVGMARDNLTFLGSLFSLTGGIFPTENYLATHNYFLDRKSTHCRLLACNWVPPV